MIKLGWKAGAEQYNPKELLNYAVAAEEAGFDSLDVSDHFHPWSEAGQASFAWTWLGAVAVRTGRIEMGTGLTCPILRYHPSIIAQAAATLSSLAPGRVYLGVGTGEALNEFAATGLWPEYKERQDRLRELIELIRALWTGEEVNFKGTYYETHKARLYTPPASPIPIYISSMVPESAHFAGLHGDGLLTVGGKEDSVYKELIKNFKEGAKEGKKETANIPYLIELNVAYTDDENAAIEEQKKYWAGAFVPALFDQKIYSPKMSEQNGEVVGGDTLKKMVKISGKPQDHIDFARRFIDLGFNQIYFHSAGPDQKAFIQGYGKNVLPRLRERS